MTSSVSRADLEAAFGADHVTVIPPERLNPLVVHPESRRFLAEVGLPGDDDSLYAPLNYLDSGLPNAHDFEPEFDYLEGLPETANHWVGLGFSQDHETFLDGATGIVWLVPEGRSEAYILNTRLDLFAQCLISVHGRWDILVGPTHYTVRTPIANALADEFEALDPMATALPESAWRYWLLSTLTDF
ncbi:SUKH-4 family immunity protein [Streptomyces profundus]|uniref:SUKH-4 family immunity protein n=1 Tax=Streptomyces profundus TaxID=2867410 RepID=UPI001D165F99|nr:SUKH-4 family immunity protein [Streptomyces sp. MA3_2.13]UED87373.1 SUKH-4 family immunity protein [Streptomyces sp. MA3_2.13]